LRRPRISVPRTCVTQSFEEYPTTLRRDFEMPTIESIQRFVQMGMGGANVPRMRLRWEVERKLLAEVRIRHALIAAVQKWNGILRTFGTDDSQNSALKWSHLSSEGASGG
jgi:hypothetical protein